MLRQRNRRPRDWEEAEEEPAGRPEVEEMRKRFREADSFDRPRRARDDQIREP